VAGEALPSGTAEINLERPSGKGCASAAKKVLCDLGCAFKSVGTRNSSTYLARRLTFAGLQFAAAMMTRTRIIQRCARAMMTRNLIIYDAYQQLCSSPTAAASWRRGNDLGATMKYLRKSTSSATGIGLGAPG
jgi:hypothetical protein